MWISKMPVAESGYRDASLGAGAAPGPGSESAALVASNRVWLDYDGRIVDPSKPAPRAWNGSRILPISNRRSPS